MKKNNSLHVVIRTAALLSLFVSICAILPTGCTPEDGAPQREPASSIQGPIQAPPPAAPAADAAGDGDPPNLLAQLQSEGDGKVVNDSTLGNVFVPTVVTGSSDTPTPADPPTPANPATPGDPAPPSAPEGPATPVNNPDGAATPFNNQNVTVAPNTTDAPTAVPWQPYKNGYWARTDAGLTWQSADPGGDITCHYGRWAYTRAYGWVWAPGSVWAPAWVAWRDGDQYSGWAPLPPVLGSVDTNISITTVDSIPAQHYVFVQNQYINSPNVSRYVMPIDRRTTLFTSTVNITQFNVINNGRTIRMSSYNTYHALNAKVHSNFPPAQMEVARNPEEARAIRSRGGVPFVAPHATRTGKIVVDRQRDQQHPQEDQRQRLAEQQRLQLEQQQKRQQPSLQQQQALQQPARQLLTPQQQQLEMQRRQQQTLQKQTQQQLSPQQKQPLTPQQKQQLELEKLQQQKLQQQKAQQTKLKEPPPK